MVLLCFKLHCMKNGFKQVCNRSKHDANLALWISPKLSPEVIMIQTLMFISVEIVCKYGINLKSTLHLLHIWYLRKSANLVYIYSRFALCGKIVCVLQKSKQTCCKSICMHHCFPTFTQTTSKNFCVRLTHVTCANIFFRTKFALLPNNQICECFVCFLFW